MKTLPNQRASESAVDKRNYTPHPLPPIVTGQCAELLEIIRQQQPIASFELTPNLAIPECAARVHNLRAKGFNIITVIKPGVEFHGSIRRNVALHSLGTPEWPAPGLLAPPKVERRRGLFDGY